MLNKTEIAISKLDAPRRQLETAIRLWFHSGDPVSVHTLAAASHQLLHDLAKRSGQNTTLRGLAEVRPERRKEVARKISQYENFFKHADHDPEKHLKFKLLVTEIFLYDAVCTYQTYTSEIIPLFGAYKMWMVVNEPDLMDGKSRSAVLSQTGGDLQSLASMSKTDFLNLVLPIVLKIGST